MGRVQVDSTVRHVSPVTARLFAKVGSEAFGIWSGEVRIRAGATTTDEHNSRIKTKDHLGEESQANQHDGLQASRKDAASGESDDDRLVEMIQPPSPPRTDRMVCPQTYLESILEERVSKDQT